MTLTEADRRMLAALQSNGRISNVELARRVGMSETACLRRLRSLEEAGIISGYRAVVDLPRVGLPVFAFIMINTDQRTETDRQSFQEAVQNEARVIDCAAISGSHDFILGVAAESIEDLSDLVMKRLLSLPTVKDVASSIVFNWLKRGGTPPI